MARGEGSRGGKVVGHTASGKPKYASSVHDAAMSGANSHAPVGAAPQALAERGPLPGNNRRTPVKLSFPTPEHREAAAQKLAAAGHYVSKSATTKPTELLTTANAHSIRYHLGK